MTSVTTLPGVANHRAYQDLDPDWQLFAASRAILNVDYSRTVTTNPAERQLAERFIQNSLPWMRAHLNDLERIGLDAFNQSLFRQLLQRNGRANTP